MLTLHIVLFSFICSIIYEVQAQQTASDVLRSLCIYNPRLSFCKNFPAYPDRLISKKAVLIPLRQNTDISQRILDIKQNEFFADDNNKQSAYPELTIGPLSIWDWMNSDPSYLTLPLIDSTDLLWHQPKSSQLRVHEIRKHRHKRAAGRTQAFQEDQPTIENNWGFVSEEKEESSEAMTEWPTEKMDKPQIQPQQVNPNQNGLLKDIGGIGVGFNVGVAVPGNDPVSVGAKVGVGLGESGLAGKLPIGENIFPRQGEHQSLNDYDGNKYDIVPDKASKYLQAIRDGRLRLPNYAPAKTLIGINGGIGVGK
ncbi:unnamed protein product [Auanema sp. JU1783]|nr:unnamed protein product [Auanema sp. JU1783]